MWIISAFVSLLTTNLILTKALGTSTLMAAAKSRSSLAVLALMMTCFSALGCMLLGGIYALFPGLSSMAVFPASLVQPLLYTAVISLIYIIVLLVLYSLSGERFGRLKKYIHLSAFNCAVMGTLYTAFEPHLFLQNSTRFTHFLGMTLRVDRLSIPGAALFGLQSGLGFLLAACMLAAVRKRLYAEEVPAAFRGFPAVMIYIGLLSMAAYAITA